MPRDNQKEVVFEAIQRLQPASLERLREATGLGLSTIRRHVSKLYAQGLVERKRSEKTGSAGRPPELWSAKA